MIEIAGDMLEGGGQILRTAIAFSAALQEPVSIKNIRANRRPPGLRAQHLHAVKAVADLTSANVEGAELGSTHLEFEPEPPHAGQFNVDIGTAGSIALVLQAMIPAMAFGPAETVATLTGGTNNPMAPTIDFQQTALMPTVAKMGVQTSLTLLRRGFYPRGGGIVEAAVTPVPHLHPIRMEELEKAEQISGISYSSQLPGHIVERMAQSAKERLQEQGFPNVAIELEHLERGDDKCALNPGCGIALFAQLSSGAVLAGDQLGELGKPAEKVGQEAADQLLEQLRTRAPVDRHLCDQLILWVSLASGTSTLHTSQLSLHTLTCMEVSKMMTGAEFKVEGRLGERTLIRCKGVGLKNKRLGN